MPAGAGRSFDLHSRFGNIALGGWLLTGSMTLQSGPPLAWGNVIYLGGPIHFDTHQPNGLTFDTTKFNTVSSQQLEYNVRSFDTYFNNLRRDPTKNLDTSLTKRFRSVSGVTCNCVSKASTSPTASPSERRS